MPPRDPKDRPALERADPGDSGDFTDYRADDSAPWDFVFGDGEWHRVSVRAWWADRFGRRVVQIEWHADGSTWGEAFVVAAEMMREVEG